MSSFLGNLVFKTLILPITRSVPTLCSGFVIGVLDIRVWVTLCRCNYGPYADLRLESAAECDRSVRVVPNPSSGLWMIFAVVVLVRVFLNLCLSTCVMIGFP